MISENVQKILNLINDLSKLVDEIPPIQQPMRFGNKSFRTWLDTVTNNSKKYHKNILSENLYQNYIDELFPYFNESFGNHTRIDYGTGHETNFILWLCKYIIIITTV